MLEEVEGDGGTCLTKTILILGFSKFPGVPYNPAEGLVRHLAETNWTPDPTVAVDYQVLSTTFAAAEQVTAKIHCQKPYDLILAFGVDAQADGFQLERVARNFVSMQKLDADGVTSTNPLIEKQGPEFLLSHVDVSGLADTLNAQGYRCRVSEDAGDYVCNFLYFKLLLKSRDSGDILFVHIPQIIAGEDKTEVSGFEMEVLTEGAKAITRQVLAEQLKLAILQA